VKINYFCFRNFAFSPIIDEEGNLVGVNFAGMRNTQSFNYAVPIKNLKKLLDE
jgi:S1-C subfamily serine protease